MTTETPQNPTQTPPIEDPTLATAGPPVAELPYDALLVLGFGGPEGPDDVMPFLENVTRGRNVPRERLLEVAEHYHHYGGVSPINQQCRDLIAALGPELQRRGLDPPIYWGNRNWHPMLEATMREMTSAGVKRALALALSAYSSYSGCRQYREDIQRARRAVGEVRAPRVDKLRVWYNHPDWIAVNAERVREGIDQLPEALRAEARVAFTAHSIPMSMATHCHYERQLRETCRLVTETLNIPEQRWSLVYQSRSGRPTDPWLEPDILDHLRARRAEGVEALVVQPIGFLSDHMEVLFDLDEEARELSEELGLLMVRAGTAGTHPRFISMLGELIAERVEARADRRATGRFGPNHDVCPPHCCPPPSRPRPRPQTAEST